MTKELRMLAPESFREALSRRAFLKVGTVAAGLAVVVVACGGSDSSSDTTVSSDTTAPGGVTPSGVASGDWSRVINQASGTLAMYTWGDYDDPELVGALADKALGVTMKVDYYASNEDLITKLATAGGSSGFDIVVPTGPYIPQMINKGLIQKFDKALLPNMVNVDPLYLGQAWDTTNDYSVCKNWGSTGFIYDTTKISRELTSWQDFIDVCMGEASGQCSVIDAAPNVAGMYFWSKGIDWNTEDKADLDAYEKFMVDEFASHIKAFDSYPSTKLAEGAYSIAMAWNGDARQAYVRIKEAGGTPENWKWVLGTPDTELWMDNFCIAQGAPNIEAAHAWINWILIPERSVQDLQYHGYNTGMKNMSALITEIAPDLEKGDMIFFEDAEVKTMHTQILNTSIDRLVDILNKVKAKAGG
ncbi:MAG: spermidine/putrescine ABC transporter substrate-binding protein [Ilumatobacteraceae bacterium]|nr:spermidine/putrescine ABC transporter substrate-binding protein [Ilumatobacteraceae bacterium]